MAEKSAVETIIDRVLKNKYPLFTSFLDKNDEKWYWHLEYRKGYIIAASGEGFDTVKECEAEIELVKNVAPSASYRKLD